jgi:hypothetical protein
MRYYLDMTSECDKGTAAEQVIKEQVKLLIQKLVCILLQEMTL